jgi:hypothetical protein
MVLRAIYAEDIEFFLGDDREPFVIDPQFPSRPLLIHLGMRFSPSHENTGYLKLKHQ